MLARLRDILVLLSAFLVLAGLGGFAWLTNHPEAPILDEMVEWPAIGPLAERFRDAYRQPEPVDEPETEAPSYTIQELITERLDKPAARRPPPATLDQVWVEPGTILYRGPSTQTAVLAEIDVYANVQKLDQRGDWYKIWRPEQTGWVYLEGYAAREARQEPVLGSKPAAPLPLEPRPPDPEKLEMATRIFGDDLRRGTLGPYALYTDIDNAKLLEHLDGLASQVEPAYVERYGLQPLGHPQAAVILYAREGAYRILQARSPDLVGLHAAGHASSGLVAFFTGRRPRSEVAGTLVHELVHLINRRALGPALPPWLDEGLADDLALADIADGKLVPTRLRTERQRDANRITYRGGAASLLNLRAQMRSGRLTPLRELMQLDWETFVRRSDSRLNYAQSALWVRFLLDGQSGRFREGFRAYLADVAKGQTVDGEALRSRLDLEWERLDAAFRAWIEFETFTIQ